MRNIIEAILKMACKMISCLLGPRYSEGLAKRLLEMSGSQKFVTYHSRPRKTGSVSTMNDTLKKEKKLAVILQGPVITENDFTLETLKLYQKHFPDQSLILSTWEQEDESVIAEVKRMGVHCILNTKPDYFGLSNINLQIVSSRAGVQAASTLGCEYVFKTRTDQRMYAPNVAEYLYNVIKAFPVMGDYPKQNKRIVGVSLNTFKYRMYGLSDMAVYGHIDDMLLYWGVKEDRRVFDSGYNQETRKILSCAESAVCEIYLATEFLKAIDRDVLWTLQDSWQAFADHFCVVDKEQLDVFWPKYGRQEYRHLSYQQSYEKEELGFREWFNLYCGLGNKVIDPHLTPEYLKTI